MQAKTNALATTAGSLTLKISTIKTGHLGMHTMNSRNNESIMLNEEVVGEVDHFSYLGSKVFTAEIERKRSRSRLQKQARPSPCFGVLGDPRISARRLRSDFSKAIVLSSLLYGAES